MNGMTCADCGRVVTARHWYRSGRPRCRNNRLWTRARLWKLMECIERGWEDERIAAALGTTVGAIQLARKRHGIPSRTKTLLSAQTAAQRLGLGCGKTIVHWIESGWLTGRRGPRRGANRQWLIHPDDVLAFMERPEHWHRWHPERIPDPGLREWATELRFGVRFLTMTEAAKRCFVEPQTVYQWVRKGWLPAVRNGNHLVRESDLERFVLPRIGGYRRAA